MSERAIPAAFGASAAIVLLWRIANAVDRLNKQVENVRFYLGELENRQERMANEINEIEHHALVSSQARRSNATI